jgi:hypothetical protein
MLNRLPELKKRAYLARFLKNIDIPEENFNDESMLRSASCLHFRNVFGFFPIPRPPSLLSFPLLHYSLTVLFPLCFHVLCTALVEVYHQYKQMQDEFKDIHKEVDKQRLSKVDPNGLQVCSCVPEQLV